MKLLALTLLILTSCSDGEKNTASITSDVITRMVEQVAEPRDLQWLNSETDLTANVASAFSVTDQLASDGLSTVTYAIDTTSSSCDDATWSPELLMDSSSGEISGTLLSNGIGSCTIVITATTSVESISKTLNITTVDEAPLTEVTSITLIDPVSSPSNEINPTLEFATLTIGETINIYTDSSCSDGNLLESFTASSATEQHVLVNALTDGSYDFYAKRHFCNK